MQRLLAIALLTVRAAFRYRPVHLGVRPPLRLGDLLVGLTLRAGLVLEGARAGKDRVGVRIDEARQGDELDPAPVVNLPAKDRDRGRTGSDRRKQPSEDSQYAGLIYCRALPTPTGHDASRRHGSCWPRRE